MTPDPPSGVSIVCPSCNGRGYVIVRDTAAEPIRLTRSACDICEGTGQILWPPEEDDQCPTPSATPSDPN